MNKAINEESFKAGYFEMNENTGFEIDEVDNIILNMSAGVLPEYLVEDEVNMLVSRYGEDWFEKLGYTEPLYKKPKYQIDCVFGWK